MSHMTGLGQTNWQVDTTWLCGSFHAGAWKVSRIKEGSPMRLKFGIARFSKRRAVRFSCALGVAEQQRIGSATSVWSLGGVAMASHLYK